MQLVGRRAGDFAQRELGGIVRVRDFQRSARADEDACLRDNYKPLPLLARLNGALCADRDELAKLSLYGVLTVLYSAERSLALRGASVNWLTLRGYHAPSAGHTGARPLPTWNACRAWRCS